MTEYFQNRIKGRDYDSDFYTRKERNLGYWLTWQWDDTKDYVGFRCARRACQ